MIRLKCNRRKNFEFDVLFQTIAISSNIETNLTNTGILQSTTANHVDKNEFETTK
jgi:hypothetical protein